MRRADSLPPTSEDFKNAPSHAQRPGRSQARSNGQTESDPNELFGRVPKNDRRIQFRRVESRNPIRSAYCVHKEIRGKAGIPEQLTEEELVIIDLLTKPDMKLATAEEREVKKVARELLETLKKERLVLDWKKRQATRAAALADFFRETPLTGSLHSAKFAFCSHQRLCGEFRARIQWQDYQSSGN